MAELINERDSLNTGRKKLNEAIKDADKAKSDSNEAKTKAEQALLKSESTQEQLNQVVIDGDSSVEAAQARVDEKGQPHSTLKERIDDGFTKVNTQLAETDDELNYIENKKMNKDTTDISVSQINKNKGKFDQTYLSDELLQQIAGDAPVNAEPRFDSVVSDMLTNRAITPAKLDGVIISKNIADKDGLISGVLSPSHGGINESTTSLTSPFIVVFTEKVVSNYPLRVNFYDTDRNFIGSEGSVSSQEAKTVYSIPEDTKYIRYSTYHTIVDNLQVEFGDELSDYVPNSYYLTRMGSYGVDQFREFDEEVEFDEGLLIKKTVKKGLTTFLTEKHHYVRGVLFNTIKRNHETGLYQNTNYIYEYLEGLNLYEQDKTRPIAVSETGREVDSSTANSTEYISTLNNESIYMNLGANVVFFDKARSPISRGMFSNTDAPHIVPFPNGTKFIRLTVSNVNAPMFKAQFGEQHQDDIKIGQIIKTETFFTRGDN